MKKVGRRESLDQLSTLVKLNYRYKTDRADLEGAGFDIHSAIGKLPAPQKRWTLPGHNYNGPYNPLEQQLKYNPETGEIVEIYQQPTGPTDAVSSNMTLITVAVLFVNKNMVKMRKAAQTRLNAKWSRRLIQSHGKKTVGACIRV